MKVLVIGAHPDDETFGMGGTLARHMREGDKVFVLILTDGVTARGGDILKQHEAFVTAMRMYGVAQWKHLKYTDQQLDFTPLLGIVRTIETVIHDFRPEIIYTHSREDVGQDHRRVYEATLLAARPLMGAGVQKLVSYASPSSTWWGDEAFRANYYVDITQDAEKKQEVIEQAYQHEVRSEAHPRSYAGIRMRENWLGHLIGIVGQAEEFRIVREIW